MRLGCVGCVGKIGREKFVAKLSNSENSTNFEKRFFFRKISQEEVEDARDKLREVQVRSKCVLSFFPDQ